jgi:hypothetical protein
MNAKLIRNSGRAVWAVFVVSVVSILLPLDLTSPAWGSRLSTLIVDAASLPLVGLLLMRYAAHLDAESDEPAEPFAPDPIQGLRRLAFVGFISLLFLAMWQFVLLSSSYNVIDRQKLAGLTQIDQQFGRLQRSLDTGTADQISQYFKQSQNPQSFSTPNLDPAEQRKSLQNQLKQRKLEALEQLNETDRDSRISILRDLLRVILVSVIYAWAFYGIAKL